MSMHVAPASMVEDDGMVTIYEDDVGELSAQDGHAQDVEDLLDEGASRLSKSFDPKSVKEYNRHCLLHVRNITHALFVAWRTC